MLRRLPLRHEVRYALQTRTFGDSPSRVRPREVKRQGLRRATEIEISGTVMLVFLFVIPAFLVTGWGPGFMKQKEKDQEWALNLAKDREAGLPRYWNRKEESTTMDSQQAHNQNQQRT